MMKLTLKKFLGSGEILIADGATGTMLMEAGLPSGSPPEIWNVENPDQISQLHIAYIQAGSKIILTNTFGGSKVKLAKSSLGERAFELNLAAAQLARRSALENVFVAGDIGPTGELMKPLGSLTYNDAYQAFKEQATALVEGGVDVLWIETMTDLEEARAAVSAAIDVTDLPIFCTMSFGTRGRTMMGVSAARAAKSLWPLGLTAIGANCGEGVSMIPDVLRQMRETVPEAILIAKPNAGLPHLVAGKTVYDLGPEKFAAHVGDFISSGARIVGACCGSSPAHIRAISEAISS